MNAVAVPHAELRPAVPGIVCKAEIMSDKKQPKQSEEDSKLQREIQLGREFSLAEAIGRLGGGDLLKGDSPVPRKRQAEFEVERYLEQNLFDSEGALEVVLLRRVRNSEMFLQRGPEKPLATLALLTEHILNSDTLLQDFVTEVDREWGRMFLERPHLQQAGSPPDADDPYTFSSVRRTLSNLVGKLRKE
jgi:hypothetical protein